MKDSNQSIRGADEDEILRFDPERGLAAQFDLQARRSPNDAAILCGSQTLSYADLDQRARAVAIRLLEDGVARGDRVGLLAERGIEAIVGMLACARIGAAYVPLVPSYHEAQIGFIAGDVGLRAVLHATDLSGDARTLAPEGAAVIGIGDSASGPTEADFADVSGSDIAYILYTSGSTGRPKGVEVRHRGVARIAFDQKIPLFVAGERVLHCCTLAGDISAGEIWGTLLSGGTIAVVEDARASIGAIAATIAEHRVDVATFYAGIFHLLIETRAEALAPLRIATAGGDTMSASHMARLRKACPDLLIGNMYGPTETTIFTHLHIVTDDEIAAGVLSLGKPIGHTECLVLDADLREVPAGQPGQCAIAGHAVAAGYLNRPELTDEKFVPDPRPGRTGTIYLTGDMVHVDEAGNLYFRGRVDRQVKLGGRRIELDEIEAALRRLPFLSDASVALVEGRDCAPVVAAFVKPADGSSENVERDVRAALGRELPDTMIPRVFRVLDTLPLAANGKVDRKRLVAEYESARDGADASDAAKRPRPDLEYPFEPPRGALERYVAEMWSEILAVDRVGRKDRFFELGGTSMMVLRFLERLEADRGHRIAVAEFFDAPTVADIASRAEAASRPIPEAPVASPPRGSARDDRIAIVGLGGRFAGAPDISAFWDMLISGRSGRVEITREDMIAAGLDPALLDDPDYVRAAFPLDEAECFDAAFFGMSPREVELMDPQQRVFLEVAWTTLEDAGCNPREAAERIGVFGGVGRNAYLLNNLMSHPRLRDAAADYNMMIGNERDFPSTHVAFRLGLRGPAITVQTGCSTSGVAIHMAAESLRRDECDIALAGGVKVLVPNRVGYRYVEGGPLSPDGFIRAFDADAAGMARGSGAAMVALKRLDDAVANGDHVYAVMLGSAINNDGARRAGFTAPSVSGQAEVIGEAHRRAGIEAGSISLIEAHGTGTALGDPIEVTALTRAFRSAGVEANGYCAIGSVKTNIGHLDAGATAASVVKAALALEREAIPPSLNFVAPNPKLELDGSPFRIAHEALEWKRGESPRRAGISSFGLGGTNAHLVIEEAPLAPARAPASEGPQLFVLSARTETALARRCDDLADWLEGHPDADLGDVAHTLRVGRHRFEARIAFVANDRADAIAKLRERLPQDMLRTGLAAETVPVAYMFPGTGAQYAGMAEGLYRAYPVFAETLDDCSRIFERLDGSPLAEIIFAGGEDLDRTSRAMPAIFAVELAMARLLRSWGVVPDRVIGHSLGEYACACVADVMSVEDAMAAVHRRATLLEGTDAGAMVSVPLSEVALRDRLEPGLSIAAINRDDQCVVAGAADRIDTFARVLEDEGVAVRRLPTAVALHSPMVDPILDEFRSFMRGVTLHPPAIPFVSCLTGEVVSDDAVSDPEYWVRHLREPVRFTDGLGAILSEPEALLLEVGPGQTLSSFARQHPKRGTGHEVSATIRHPREEATDPGFLLATLGRAWRAGARIDWARSGAVTGRRRIPLPTYPFERKRFWVDAIPFGEADGTAVVADGQAVRAAGDAAISNGADAAGAAPGDAAPQTRFDAILARLRTVIHELSGLPYERIDDHSTFLELGFDSLFLTQANAAFRKEFGVRLTARQLLEKTPGLYLLAGHLDEVLEPDAVPLGGQRRADAPTPQGGKEVAPVPDGESALPTRSPGIAAVERGDGKALSAEQSAHIRSLIETTNRRTPKAKDATQASRRVLADPRTVQGFRSQWKDMVYPILSDRAEGARVWDTDGNAYIDLVGGYGVSLVGHRPAFLTDALRTQIDRTLAIGPQTVLAGEVAQMVSEMTGMERVAFCNTGSEAVLAAVRMARTVTGRSKIAKFDGHYHGIFDEMQARGIGTGREARTLPSAPGIPDEAVQNTMVLRYGSEDAFDILRENADEIAAMLVEPIRSRNPDYQPREYLRKLREVTKELGIPLIFDEMVTGFRSHPGGVQELFGVRADIATYGKVVGGGLPIGVVAGSAQFMDTLDGGFWEFGDASVPPADMTWFAGTFVRHPLSLAAAKAMLGHLRAEGPALQEGLNARSKALADRLNASFEALRTPIRVECFASVLQVVFTAHQDHADLLFFHLRNRGVMTYEGRPIFLTTAHGDEDLDAVHDAFVDSARALIAVGLLDGRDPDAVRRIPMATGQQEIWVSAQFDVAASCSYNLCSTLRLGGALDVDALRGALDDLADRHEALRSLPERDGLMQVIRSRIDVPFEIADLSALSDADRAAAIASAKQAQVTTPFDLTEGPLVRARLLALGTDDHLLLLSVHHVIADGWSCGILLRDLGALYEAQRNGVSAALSDPLQLGDFVAMQAEPDQIAAREEARQYWLNLHRNGLSRVEFPTDRPRPATRDYSARRFEMVVDADSVAALRRAAKASGTTLFAALIGGFAAYVTRLTGTRENTLGFSAAGQPLMGSEALVGHCVSFLPLRLETELDAGFAAHLRGIGSDVLDALEHQSFDFVSFVQETNPTRDVDWAPLVSIGINLDASTRRVGFADLAVETGSVGRAFENLDLFLNFAEIDDRVELQCTYNTALFDAETIDTRMRDYVRLLEMAASRPDEPLGMLDIFAPEALAAQSARSGAGDGYDRDADIAGIFDAIVAAHGERTALRSTEGEFNVSYAELDRLSDGWAARLRAAGLGKGDRLAICLPRCAELVAVQLAALKLGVIYVPIDAATPTERVAFILSDCEASALVSDVPTAGGVPPGLTVLTSGDAVTGATVERPAVSGGDPACIMYTSGSTGLPKGVVVPHRAIARLVVDADFARLDATRTVGFLASPGFDAATFEIWGALLNGATLAVFSGQGVPEMAVLKDRIAASGVTTMWLTSALFNAIVDQDPTALSPLEELLIGGEALSVGHVARAQDALPGLRIVNGYGPTENTTFTCCHPIARGLDPEGPPVPIGRPVPHTSARIVDPDLRTLPFDTPGELVVGGDGLADGYWRRTDLTEAAFVTLSDGPDGSQGTRVYRTGDLCLMRRDGTVEFIRRMDDQLKIRGFRIEPGEIEVALESLPAVRAAVVLPVGPAGDLSLAAFVVSDDPRAATAAMSAAMRERLPRHLIPSQIRLVERFPVTSNGKIDRRALADMAAERPATDRLVAPETETERSLSRIWSDILGKPVDSVDRSFFELGGHSLNALRLFDTVSRKFGVDLPMSTLFSSPTVRDLADAIDANAAANAPASRDAPWDNTIVIHPGPGDAARAVFVAGGVGGNVNNLSDFARFMGLYRPVVGFQARGIMGHDPRQSIEEIASENIYYMRQHQRSGPYILAGYSAGAYAAFEMARQLAAAGQRVEELILLDTSAPGFDESIGMDDLSASYGGMGRGERLRREIAEFRRAGAGRFMRRAQDFAIRRLARSRAVRRAVDYHPSFLKSEHALHAWYNALPDADGGERLTEQSPTFLRSRRTTEAWLDAARRYGGGPFDGHACLVVSARTALWQQDLQQRHPDMGWSRFIDLDRLTIHRTEADHIDMVQGHHGEALVAFLQERLRASRPQR